MILKFYELILLKIIDIYKSLKIWPSGYKIDSILYLNLNYSYFDLPECLEESDLWHCVKDYNPKNSFEGIQENLNTTKINYLFGCAGCGKTTKIYNNMTFGSVAIVKNYMLKHNYILNNKSALIHAQIMKNYFKYPCSSLYIEEAGTFTNNEINEILNIAGYYNVNITLIGDYFQLLPINEKGLLLLQYTKHKYIYNNYRNKMKFNDSEKWIIEAIKRGRFLENEETKKKELINRYKDYIKEISEDDGDQICLRWYKSTAINKRIKTKYYILNNFNNKLPNYWEHLPQSKKQILLSKFDKDSLYTIEQIKNYEQYFINTNIISFYNTQGQTLQKIIYGSKEDYNELIKKPRSFYVLISRIKE